MANLNKVLLMGNLTRDPELRYLQSGTAVCDFGVAVNRTYRTPSGEQKEEVLFVDVTAWGKQAETVSEFLQKGRPVFIEGRLKLDQWTGQDGQKRSKLRVVMERFQFVDARRGAKEGEGGAPGGAGGAGGPGGRSQEDPAPKGAPPPKKPSPPENDFDAGDDSIPF
jgi:single-strand DNA-binding protein